MKMTTRQPQKSGGFGFHRTAILLLVLLILAGAQVQPQIISAHQPAPLAREPLVSPVAEVSPAAAVSAAASSAAVNANPDAQLSLQSESQSSRARTITYSYDDAGRLSTAGYDNGVLQRYSYDAAGNLLTQPVERLVYLPVIGR